MLELNIQLQCKKNDTMGVSTIATALAYTDFLGLLQWQPSLENGRGKRRYR